MQDIVKPLKKFIIYDDPYDITINGKRFKCNWKKPAKRAEGAIAPEWKFDCYSRRKSGTDNSARPERIIYYNLFS